MKVQGYAAQLAKAPLNPYSFERIEPRDHDVAIVVQYLGSKLGEDNNDYTAIHPISLITSL
jgi:hypothetical protein